MRRFSLLAVVALLVAACTQEIVVETIPAIADDAPETITVGFENEDTRIQLNEAQKTVWTNGDQVSVFYRSDANQKWEYNGPTGSRTADIYRVEAGQHTQKLPKVVVVYPYNENYYINPETCDIQAFMPAEQTYMKDSYGLTGGNLMVSNGEYNQFSLKNVCGWIKIQLLGTGRVEKITLRGNNGEQVAGEIYINTTDASSILASDMGGIPEDGSNDSTGGTGGNLIFDDTVMTDVTLDCGDGVALDEETPTAFFIALPPQTFAAGVSIEIMGVDGAVMTKSTSNPVVIERNKIQPMSAFTYEGSINMSAGLAYTTNDGYPLDPMTIDGFGVDFIDNLYDENTGRGMLLFEDDVTAIPAEAFLECTNLTWMRLPEGITSIGKKAFFGCTALEELTLPASVSTIGQQAFGECTGVLTVNCNTQNGSSETYGSFYGSKFSDVIVGEGVTKIGDYAFWYCDETKQFTLPSTLTTIGNSVFEGCSAIETIIIHDNIETIGSEAFYNCTSLTSATIGSGITSIGDSAFLGCSKLVSVSLGKSLKTIGNSAFRECVKLTGVVIPNNVTTIGSYVFYNCDALTEMIIPSQVTAINERAFYDCDNLQSITIGKRVTTIGEYAFSSCDKLADVSIGSGVTEINYCAFNKCKSLTTITIPSKVTSIGDRTFEECSVLKEVYCKPTTPPTLGYTKTYNGNVYYTSSNVFTNNASGRKIYVPVGSGSAYKGASWWNNYSADIVETTF